MSVSSINATTGSSAAAAVLQAQAVQYANHFASLQNAVNSEDLNGARKALASFQQASSVASANGFDPVSQSVMLREAFSSLKKAIAGGDISTAKSAMASTVQALGGTPSVLGVPSASTDVQAVGAVQSPESSARTSDAVRSGELKGATLKAGETELLTESSREESSIATLPPPSASLSIKFVPDARSLQVALKSGDPKKVSSTFVKIEPELSSFKQGPQVFPTAGMAAYTLPPTVTNSKQAVLQGMQPLFASASEVSVPGVASVKL